MLLNFWHTPPPALTALAKTGQIDEISSALRFLPRNESAFLNASMLLEDLISSPQEYSRKDEIVEILQKRQFSFITFFQDRTISEASADAGIWTMYAKDPQEETKRAAAMIAAEAIRAHIQINQALYDLPLNRFLPESQGSLKDADAARKIKESILVTQNALVDYVTKDSPGLSPLSAASCLEILKGGEATKLWQTKMVAVGVYEMADPANSNIATPVPSPS